MSTLSTISFGFSFAAIIVSTISICRKHNASYVLPVAALVLWAIGFTFLLASYRPQ
jgi:hypothetical protein